MRYKLSSYGLSHQGLVRDNNEDVWSSMIDHRFFALADGMGGHNAGEVAAKEAISFLCSSVHKTLISHYQWDLPELKSLIEVFIENANSWVRHLAGKNKKFEGMGTTLCTLLFHTNYAIHGHVGDSRIYQYRRGVLAQLTVDHSLKNDPLPQKKSCLSKNILTRAIGSSQNASPEIGIVSVLPDDIYLMCSDGLSDYVPHKEIASILHTYNSLQTATEVLIHTANAKGGNDNITVLMVKIEDNERENLLR